MLVPPSKYAKHVPTWLIHSVTYSAVITDLEGCYAYVNNAFVERFAVLNTKFIGELFTQSIHPDDIDKCMQAAGACIASPGTSVNVILRKPAKKDGQYYSSSWDFSLILDDSGAPIGIIAVGHDLTETELAARGEKQFRLRFESLIEGMRDGYIEVDDRLKVTNINSAALNTLGLDHKKSENPLLQTVLPFEHDREFETALNDTRQNLSSNICELALPDQRWLLCMLQPAAAGMRIFVRDITEQKSDQEQTKELLRITIVQNDRLKNFSHIVAHNLRAHTGNIDALLKYFAVDHPECAQGELFGHLNDASTRLSETVSNLAEVAGMTRENREELLPVSVSKAIANALQVVEPIRKSISAEITVDVDQQLKVLAIPAFLDSIALNLISNALKYHRKEVPCVVTIKLVEGERYHTLSVSDNGLGIDLNLHGAKLFGMYSTFHRHPEARGIGLFITKNQIDAMGGYIEVESTPMEGTTFHVHLRH